MNCIDFPEANITLGAPKGKEDQVYAVRAHVDTQEVITCWEPTEEELEALSVPGTKVWVRILGNTMPPIHISTDFPWRKQ